MARLHLASLAFLAIAPALHAAEPQELNTAIDRLLVARWATAKVEPAPAADDAEFLRRAYLDLTGKIPSVAATRAFLDDKSPDKRRKLVDRLLQHPSYIEHFLNVWRDILLRESNDPQAQILRNSFEGWLRLRLSENTSYDRMVREILTVNVPRNNRPRGGELALGEPNGVSPLGFYASNELKVENLAGSTARLFLAVKLECAQCHNHPFAKWSREQFWQYAAFFSSVDGQGKPREIKIPNLDKTVTARFLDGTEPSFTDKGDPRATLADWMLAPNNPYFARAAVNRMWAYFLGTGLVEPVDDLTQETDKDPLLDELAHQFAEHGYDLKYLIRGIVLSRAYGLTSRTTRSDDPRLFTHVAVRGLAPEQIFDSLVEATRLEGPLGPARAEFLTRFANQNEKRTEFQTSILQALALMNGKVVADATNLERSATLGAIADAPFMNTAERVEALFLAALTRKPGAEELQRCVRYVDSGGPSGDKRQALADVFWALLNSSEFLFNH